MTSQAPGALLFGVIMYSLALVCLVVLVVTFVRMGHTLTRINKRLDEIVGIMRTK